MVKQLQLLIILILLLLAGPLFAKPHYATLVMDYPSKTILYSENANTQNQPASLTKVITLYLVFQALNHGTLTLNQPLTVSAHAANRQPSKLGLRAHDTLTVEEAICGLVTKSANDAASVLAESLAPSEDEFAEKMTDQAHRLGMTQTTFKNASGIANKQQMTTAMDMAILGSAVMHDFPQYYHYFSLKQFTFRDRVFKNHNHLLGKYLGCDGIKTGYTTPSGFNLLSSATRDGHRLIGVVLGGNSIKSRDLRMMQILDVGFTKLASAQKTMPVNQKASPTTASLQPALEEPNTTIEEEY